MRRPRLQFKLRRILIVIALIGALIASGVLWDRRIRRLDRMVLDQTITVESANANYLNAVLNREAAEIAFAQYTGKSHEQHAGPPTTIALDQSGLLTTCDAKVADAEKQLISIIQQIDDGTYVDGALSAPSAAFQSLKHFHEALNERLAVTRSTRQAEVQDEAGQVRMGLRADIEKARSQEWLKKLILQYEKAYLNWLTRKRARPWW
jgi:hypothetical protein